VLDAQLNITPSGSQSADQHQSIQPPVQRTGTYARTVKIRPGWRVEIRLLCSIRVGLFFGALNGTGWSGGVVYVMLPVWFLALYGEPGYADWRAFA
jgi:hypothetical protein